MADSIASLKSTLGERMRVRREKADAAAQATKDRERERSERLARIDRRHAQFKALFRPNNQLRDYEVKWVLTQLDLLYRHFKTARADPLLRPDIIVCPKGNPFGGFPSDMNREIECTGIYAFPMEHDLSGGPYGVKEKVKLWRVRGFESMDKVHRPGRNSPEDQERADGFAALGICVAFLRGATARFMEARVAHYIELFAAKAAADPHPDKFRVEPADRFDNIAVVDKINEALEAADISYKAKHVWTVENCYNEQTVTYGLEFSPSD